MLSIITVVDLVRKVVTRQLGTSLINRLLREIEVSFGNSLVSRRFLSVKESAPCVNIFLFFLNKEIYSDYFGLLCLTPELVLESFPYF